MLTTNESPFRLKFSSGILASAASEEDSLVVDARASLDDNSRGSALPAFLGFAYKNVIEMTYSLEWLTENFERGKRIKYLFFWGHQKSKSGDLTASCFSQWWTSPFIVDKVKYNTAEHWMMAQKALLFGDQEVYEKIIAAQSPAEAKTLGRQVRNFDEAIWNNKRFDIVVEGSLLKFSQHQDLKEFLVNTKEKVLVEASPVDKIWGIGLAADSDRAENPKRWNGLNLLGFALMEVRDLLKK